MRTFTGRVSKMGGRLIINVPFLEKGGLKPGDPVLISLCEAEGDERA